MTLKSKPTAVAISVVFGAAVVFFLCNALSSRNSRSVAPNDKQSLVSFADVKFRADASNEFTLNFLALNLGTPTLPRVAQSASTFGELRNLLERNVAEQGGALTISSLDDIFSDPLPTDSRPGSLVALATEQGLLYCLLGCFKIDDDSYYQLVGGSAAFSLLSKELLNNLGVREVAIINAPQLEIETLI